MLELVTGRKLNRLKAVPLNSIPLTSILSLGGERSFFGKISRPPQGKRKQKVPSPLEGEGWDEGW